MVRPFEELKALEPSLFTSSSGDGPVHAFSWQRLGRSERVVRVNDASAKLELGPRLDSDCLGDLEMRTMRSTPIVAVFECWPNCLAAKDAFKEQ